MASQKPVDPDPKQVESAQRVYGRFTTLMKYSIYLTVAILAIMAITLINW